MRFEPKIMSAAISKNDMIFFCLSGFLMRRLHDGHRLLRRAASRRIFARARRGMQPPG
jgi:hypothetical protein